MDDVLIAGAGPAGAIAALILARAGVRVRLIERAKFPRHKLCGDTVNPGAMGLLRRLGLEGVTAGALPIDGMIVSAKPAVRIEGRYRGGVQGRAITRTAFDAALVERAVAAGAILDERTSVVSPMFKEGRVSGLRVSRHGGSERAVPARVVIAADGGASRVARALGLARHPVHPRRWAVGAYFRDVDATWSLGEMHVRAGRYIGVAPLPDGLANVCVVSASTALIRRSIASLLEVVREDELLRDRFLRARMVSAPVCLGPLAVESSGCGMPGCVLAGDAAGFVDPMTGDGLRFAMRGAELASQAVLEELRDGGREAFRKLAAARSGEFSRKWRFNRTLRALVASPLAIRAAAGGAACAPGWLQRAICYAGDLQTT
jgi:geranylgeranyl reductase family protein